MKKKLSIAIACQGLRFDNVAAIIFDKDGTLENSGAYWRMVALERARLIDAQIPGVGEPLQMAFGITDNNLDSQGLMAVGSREENEIAAAAYIAETGRGWKESREIAQSAFAEVAESKYLLKTAKSAPLYDDARDTLKSLSNRGIKMAIVSSDTTKAAQDFVTRYQLENYIQTCIGADQGKNKPDPTLFLQACQELNVSPEQSLMVGDTAIDMLMAQAAKAAGKIAICRQQNQSLDGADIQIDTLLKIQVL
ncbi:MAG: HAD family hydrolase [Cyanobacteria bacterium J06621_12]